MVFAADDHYHEPDGRGQHDPGVVGRSHSMVSNTCVTTVCTDNRRRSFVTVEACSDVSLPAIRAAVLTNALLGELRRFALQTIIWVIAASAVIGTVNADAISTRLPSLRTRRPTLSFLKDLIRGTAHALESM